MKCSVIYKHYLHDERLKWRQRMLTKYNLVELQNHPANISQDHLTICGFFETEEAFRIHAKHLKDEISYDFLSDPRDEDYWDDNIDQLSSRVSYDTRERYL